MSNNVANAQSFEQQGDRPSFALGKEAKATGTASESSEKCYGRGIDHSDKCNVIKFNPPVLDGQTLNHEELVIFDLMVQGLAINVIAQRSQMSIGKASVIRDSVLDKCGCNDVVEMLREMLLAEREAKLDALFGEVG